jgi:hypothetical protein
LFLPPYYIKTALQFLNLIPVDLRSAQSRSVGRGGAQADRFTGRIVYYLSADTRCCPGENRRIRQRRLSYYY